MTNSPFSAYTDKKGGMKVLVSGSVCEVYEEEARLNLCDEVLYGHSVTLIKEKGDHSLIRTKGGAVGWVNTRELAAITETEGEYVALYRTDVLGAARITSPKVFALPRFARVCVQGERDGFWRVRLLDGRCGYVHKAHLAPRNVAPPTPDEICSEALSLLGVPYRYGGRTADALDCSGLISLVFERFGVVVYRNTWDLFRLEMLPEAEARRGDLVLFQGHVGLLLTPTRFLHASAAIGFVAISSLEKTSPLFDAAHTAEGYTFCRLLPG